MAAVTYDDALEVIGRLIAVARDVGQPLGSPIVLVGGTAMAAWQIRALSNDVDVYVPSAPAQAVEDVEREGRARYGELFRLDVTTGENLWGTILVRDIARSPSIGELSGHELRALAIEDLFLLKLASGRARDLADLVLLAPRTGAVALIVRWNQLSAWHGDRGAILGYADALVVHLARLFGYPPSATIAALALTTAQRAALSESHAG